MKTNFLLSVLGLFAMSGCSSTTAETADTSEEQLTACTPADQAAKLETMVNSPIIPRLAVGGLYIGGGTLAVGDVEAILCSGNQLGNPDSTYYGFGDNTELVLDYSEANPRTVRSVQVNAGYKGKVTFASRPGSRFGAHTYEIGVGTSILRDGAAFAPTWTGSHDSATELYDALMYTFAPNEPGDDVDCVASFKCFLKDFGARGAMFGTRSLRFYVHVPSAAAAPGSHTPDYLFLNIEP